MRFVIWVMGCEWKAPLPSVANFPLVTARKAAVLSSIVNVLPLRSSVTVATVKTARIMPRTVPSAKQLSRLFLNETRQHFNQK
jgi:hypothetical protein